MKTYRQGDVLLMQVKPIPTPTPNLSAIIAEAKKLRCSADSPVHGHICICPGEQMCQDAHANDSCIAKCKSFAALLAAASRGSASSVVSGEVRDTTVEYQDGSELFSSEYDHVVVSKNELREVRAQVLRLSAQCAAAESECTALRELVGALTEALKAAGDTLEDAPRPEHWEESAEWDTKVAMVMVLVRAALSAAPSAPQPTTPTPAKEEGK